MSKRILALAATATLMIGVAAISTTANAAVTGAAHGLRQASEAVDLKQDARRICRSRLRCPKLFQCHWERNCTITPDYPPEHRR